MPCLSMLKYQNLAVISWSRKDDDVGSFAITPFGRSEKEVVVSIAFGKRARSLVSGPEMLNPESCPRLIVSMLHKS